jgi:hypothetical protein
MRFLAIMSSWNNKRNILVLLCIAATAVIILHLTFLGLHTLGKCQTVLSSGEKQKNSLEILPLGRDCISPENDKPWIFGEECITNFTYGISQTSNQTCGLCGGTRFASYLSQLSKQIKSQKEFECTRLVVYGVAFGSTYINWLTGRRIQSNQSHVEMLLKKHNHCFLTFVLAESLNYSKKDKLLLMPLTQTSNDGLQILVPIHRSDLPYDSMRRNTKIFKMMGPSLLFSWAQRVFWQDAKLVGDASKPLPSDYFEYFHKTIEKNHVCASFMGLPLHKNTMGTPASKNKKLQTIQFAGHCAAIVEASVKRPTVSDGLETLQNQCSAYYQTVSGGHPIDQTTTSRKLNPCHNFEIQHKSYATSESLLLDKALIDSAFMVWDMRSPRCQKFVADISCTWLDEIHCYSDRDQVSFPFVFVKMGLREIDSSLYGVSSDNSDSSGQVAPETHHRVFAHYSTPSMPIVHITKSSCHWYFQNLDECDFAQNDHMAKKGTLSSFLPNLRIHSWLESGPTQKSHSKKLRLAIMVAGSLGRFIFQSSIQHLIQPLVRQGHHVDYFLTLGTEHATAYRAAFPYMSHLVQDPIFGDLSMKGNNTTDFSRIVAVVQQQLKAVRGTLRHISLHDTADIGGNEQVQKKRNQAISKYPNEDADLRFPVLDIREHAKAQTANANRNMLNLFLSIQQLWQKLVDAELEDGISYDLVLFLRDDTLWLADFDMNFLLTSSGSADLYVPSCNAREPPMVAGEINDHIAIVSREKAVIFGNYLDELFVADLDACAASMDASVRMNGKRGCNSEMILQWVLQDKNVSIQKVEQKLIPFQRSAFVKMPDDHVKACFHKHCQSHRDRLSDAGLTMCKTIFF